MQLGVQRAFEAFGLSGGTTLKSFSVQRPPELNFEGYRPSSRRTRHDEPGAHPLGPGQKPAVAGSPGPHISVSQVETPRSRTTIGRLTVVASPRPAGRGNLSRQMSVDMDSNDDEARRREACESLWLG